MALSTNENFLFDSADNIDGLQLSWIADEAFGEAHSSSSPYFDDGLDAHLVNSDALNTWQLFEDSEDDFSWHCSGADLSLPITNTRSISERATNLASFANPDDPLPSETHLAVVLDHSALLDESVENSIEFAQSSEDLNGFSNPPSLDHHKVERNNSLDSIDLSGLPVAQKCGGSQGQAHNFEDMITTFEINPNLPGSVKRRSPYQKKRRQEVALMRKVKPCMRCRRGKVSVHLNLIAIRSPLTNTSASSPGLVSFAKGLLEPWPLQDISASANLSLTFGMAASVSIN